MCEKYINFGARCFLIFNKGLLQRSSAIYANTNNSRTSYTDRCFNIEVLAPLPAFVPDVGGANFNPPGGSSLEFRAGCNDAIIFSAKVRNAQINPEYCH